MVADILKEFFTSVGAICDFALDFFAIIANSVIYLFDVFLHLPVYFVAVVTPFIALFFVLMILDRG